VIVMLLVYGIGELICWLGTAYCVYYGLS